MQAGGGMVAVQTVTPGAQGPQPQMVMVPVSGAMGYQPQLVEAVPSEATTTVYQPQEIESPKPSRHGGYMRLTNEPVHV